MEHWLNQISHVTYVYRMLAKLILKLSITSASLLINLSCKVLKILILLVLNNVLKAVQIILLPPICYRQTLEKHEAAVFKNQIELCVKQPFDAAVISMFHFITKLAKEETQSKLIYFKDMEEIVKQSDGIRVRQFFAH